MKFGQQILATLIGTIAGFIFSIILFYLTNKWKINSYKKNVVKNFSKEIEYNLSLINRLHSQINDVISKVTADRIDIYTYLDYKRYQRLFLDELFRQEVLYERLNQDEVSEIDTILFHFSIVAENYMNKNIEDWKARKIDRVPTLRSLEFERDQLEGYRQTLQNIKLKICK
jgi:uncharacterized membrane protein YgaE (UPF0421/DUF939 family)